MADEKPAVRVRVTGSGPLSKGYRIVDAETGAPLRGVRAVTFRADCRNEPARLVIELIDFDLDVEMEAQAKRFGLEPKPRGGLVDTTAVGDEWKSHSSIKEPTS